MAAVLGLSLAKGNIQIHSPGRQFLPIYLLKRNQAPGRYTTSLLVQNSSGESGRMRREQPAQLRRCVSIPFIDVSTGSDISDFIHNLESQNIKVEMMKHSDYMAAAPHSAAINVTGSSKVSEETRLRPH